MDRANEHQLVKGFISKPIEMEKLKDILRE